MTLAPRIDLIEASFRKRNFLINPSMDIWQRGDTANSISDLQYFADRYQWRQGGGAGTVDVTKVVDNPTGIGNSMRFQVTNAQTPTGFDIFAFEQKIEGLNSRLLYGKDCRLDFWVKTNKPGVYSLIFFNHDFTRNYTTEYTVSSTNTWEKISITLTMDAFGPKWLDDNNIGIQVFWTLAAGDSRKTPSLETWQDVVAAEANAGTNQTNFMDTIGNYFQMTNCQLVTGHEEVPFEYIQRDFGEEVRVCQRYYEKSYNLETKAGTATSAGCESAVGTYWHDTWGARFKTRKRTYPSVTIYNTGNGAAGTVWDSGAGSVVRGFTVIAETGYYLNSGNIHIEGNVISWQWTADAEL